MRKFPFRFTLAMLWLAASAVGLAQTTASLTGTALHDGQPLPGVTVEVRSPALQGSRTAVTGENGVYFFSALPPGDYTVTFDMQGMQTVTEKVRLSLSQTSRVDAQMRLGTVAEAITITASAPAVIEGTEVGTNVTTEMLDKLPVGRTIAAAVLMAPGISNSGIGGGPSIAGAPSNDNMYLVNGVVVGENVRGQPHNLFIEDAIQETTILTGGISAEYGRFTGGVINTITKSGGNEFSGSLRDNLTNPAWRKKTPWPTEADHIDDISEIYEATLGGRVIRDRLWFFAAGRLRETQEQLFTNVTNLPFARGREETRLEGKLTGQLTAKHSLVGSYIDITDDLINDFQFLIMDRTSLINRSLPNSLMSILYSGVLTQNLLVEANYSEKEFAFIGSGSQFRDRIFGTLLVDSGNTNRRYWTSTFCGVCTQEKRDNNAWLAKGTYFLSTAGLGSHNITAGVEDFTEIRIANNHQSGSDYRIIGPVVRDGDNVYPRFDTTSIIQWNPIFTFSEGTDLGTMGVFINDKWDLNNHWSFNLGVRYDQNDAQDADGHVISDDSEISPRLGMQFDIFGDGRHKINANYARYVTKITEGNVAGHGQAAGVSSAFQWRYGGPVVNAPGSPLVPTEQALQTLWNWFDSVGGTNNRDALIFAAESGLSGRIEQPIASPSADELTVGYAVQIGRNAFLRTDVVAREWNNFYAQRVDQSTPQVSDRFGNVGDVAFLENDDSLKREYFGVLMQGQWRPGRAYMGGSYTYSELKGNDEGEGATTATSPNTPLEIFYPEFLSYERRRPEGWLPEDVRHRARAWLGYELPIPVVGRVNASLLHTFETGAPYSAIAFIDATGRSTGTAYEGLPANPGYTLSQAGTQHRYFFSERGEFRTDDYNRTDFALNYALPIAGLELFVQALLTNVFDNDAVVGAFVEGAAGGVVALTGPDTTVFTRRTSSTRGLSAFNPFTQTPIECPQGASPQTCQGLGAHWQKGENFGRPNSTTSFQLPFSYAFTAGIRF